VLESREVDAREQIPNQPARCLGDANADRSPLSRQREKIFDRHRQRRVDRKALRHVANRAGTLPVERDSPLEGGLTEDRRQERALAGAVRSDDDVQCAARHAQRHAVDDRLALAADRDAVDLDHRRRDHVVGHASVTSARTIVSTFFCISRSNLSAV
jgi:hypothetical protein